MAAGLAMPVPADAKPPDAAVSDAGDGRDLNAILRKNGWTVLDLTADAKFYKPGEVFEPGASAPWGTCIDATPITGNLPDIKAEGSKGFVVDVGASKGNIGGSVGSKATSYQLKSIANVTQSLIKGMDMQLSSRCIELLQKMQAEGKSLEGWSVLQETVQAEVKEFQCSSREEAVRVRALWVLKGEIGRASSCGVYREATGVIAFKAKSVTELMKMLPVKESQVPATVTPERRPSKTLEVKLKMVHIEPGSFIMGCTLPHKAHCKEEEKPTRKVTLTRAFWAATTEVTQDDYQALMGSNPSLFTGGNRPVENVSWSEALTFANRLSEQHGLEPCYKVRGRNAQWPEGLDCKGYRLPTEAEWEYMARAGQDTLYAGGDNLDDVGWYAENSGEETKPVGQKKPNAWGLYDLSGNVHEYVWDASAHGTTVADRMSYRDASSVDPTGASTPSAIFRLQRGGSWANSPLGVRVSYRKASTTRRSGRGYRGFRLVRTIP